MSWSSLEPLDRAFIAIAACLILLLAGVVRTWALSHRLMKRNLEVNGLIADQALQIEDLRHRLIRLESVSQAHEADERKRHDEGVATLLESLLDFNESLRNSPGGKPSIGPNTGAEAS